MKTIYKIEIIIWIFIFSTFIYLLLPLLLNMFSIDITSIICVLFINVIYSFVFGLLFTKKYGFTYLYPIINGIMFIPISLMIYNETTTVYSLFYIIVGLLSSLIYYKTNYKYIKNKDIQ